MGNRFTWDEGHIVISAPEMDGAGADAHDIAADLAKQSDNPDGDIALAGRDGKRAEQLLAAAQEEGTAVLADVTKRALKRWLAAGPYAVMMTRNLYNAEEMADIAEAIAATNSTANLLGRSRILLRQEQIELAREKGERFNEDGNTFEVFDSATRKIEPMPPEKALSYFGGLVPKLGSKDPERFGADQRRRAFTLAAATDETTLRRVQKVVSEALSSGEGVSTAPRRINEILERAGVSPKSADYASMVMRTNMMDSYNQGAQGELSENADFFPVWKYANPSDSRSRPEHSAKNGQYYPSSVPFVSVRGKDISDAANCRCVLPGNFVQGRILAASKATYSGQAVELKTLSGARLTVTVNHPILTAQGFVAAGKVEKGQHLASYRGEVNRLVKVDDEQHTPASIEDVFSALKQLDSLRITKRWTALDFHGDGAAVQDEIEIVGANGALLLNSKAHRAKDRQQGFFSRRDRQQLGLLGCRSGNVGFRHLGSSRLATQHNARFIQPQRDDIPGNAKFQTQRLQRLAALVATGKLARVQPFDSVGAHGIANRNARGHELPAKSFVLNSRLFSQGIHRLTSLVAGNQRLKVGESLGVEFFCGESNSAKLHERTQPLTKRDGAKADFGSQGGNRFPGSVTPGEFLDIHDSCARGKPRSFGPAAQLDAPLTEPVSDSLPTNAELLGELIERFPGNVFLDKIVEVNRFHYSGPVYDLQTTTGYYTCSATLETTVIIANCTMIPVDKFDWKELQAGGARLADGYSLPEPAARPRPEPTRQPEPQPAPEPQVVDVQPAPTRTPEPTPEPKAQPVSTPEPVAQTPAPAAIPPASKPAQWQSILDGIQTGDTTSENYRAKVAAILEGVPREEIPAMLRQLGLGSGAKVGPQVARQIVENAVKKQLTPAAPPPTVPTPAPQQPAPAAKPGKDEPTATFGSAIADIARAIPVLQTTVEKRGTHFGDNKVFISAIWDQYKARYPNADRNTFNALLVNAARRGEIDLVRADLAESMNLQDQAQSEIVIDSKLRLLPHGQKSQGPAAAEFHLVKLGPPKHGGK